MCHRLVAFFLLPDNRFMAAAYFFVLLSVPLSRMGFSFLFCSAAILGVAVIWVGMSLPNISYSSDAYAICCSFRQQIQNASARVVCSAQWLAFETVADSADPVRFQARPALA